MQPTPHSPFARPRRRHRQSRRPPSQQAERARQARAPPSLPLACWESASRAGRSRSPRLAALKRARTTPHPHTRGRCQGRLIRSSGSLSVGVPRLDGQLEELCDVIQTLVYRDSRQTKAKPQEKANAGALFLGFRLANQCTTRSVDHQLPVMLHAVARIDASSRTEAPSPRPEAPRAPDRAGCSRR